MTPEALKAALGAHRLEHAREYQEAFCRTCRRYVGAIRRAEGR